MNKSHLLINEPALQVLPSLAKSIGLEEAIILQQLHYWLNNPKVEGRLDEVGQKWIYNSYQEWQENFPFWSIQQIQRIFLNLEKGGVVISAKLDAKKHDQTKFYRLDYDVLCTMEYIKIDSSIVSESNDVNKVLHRLPETTQKKGDLIDGILFYGNKAIEQGIDEVEQVAVKLETGLRFNFPRGTKDQAVYKRILKSGKPVERFIEWVKSDEKRLSYAFLYAKDTETIWRDWPQVDTGTNMNPQGLEIGV
jgi:hypothetical protein